MAHDQIAEMDVEYAAAVASGAVEFMAKNSVPATPENFSVWFNYAMGTSPALRKTIDILVSGKRKFNAAVNQDLYTTYINPKSASARPDSFPEQLQALISNANHFLAEAIFDNRTQIESLGDVSSQVRTGSDPRPLIERLVVELANATDRATALEASFTATSQDLDKIRSSLAESEERSNTDPLTGLANRRSMDEFLRSAQINAMENDEPLSVFLIDIDHFKKFNDNFGHQIGDQVLRLVAKVLKDNVRDQDLAARYGGEELFAVLPGAELGVCTAVAERIRQRISDARLTRRTTGQDISRVTVSIGVAQFKLAESAETMIERCDRALYQAKQAGRNQTVTELDIQG